MNERIKAQLIEATLAAIKSSEEKLGRKLSQEEIYNAIKYGMEKMIAAKING